MSDLGLQRCLVATSALVLGLVASGCTITTHSGGVESPHEHEHASSGSSSKPHRPARPDVAKADAAKPAKPEPKPEPDPEPPVTKPEPKPVTKPEPKPEPKPVTKPEPKPPVTKPEPTREPKPDPTPPVKKPEPKPPVKKPEPKPPVTQPEPPKDDGFVFGVPPDMTPGHPDAVWVYQDANGWHFRTTTTNKVLRKFKGRIWLTEGSFASVKASVGDARNEDNDVLTSTSQRVDFAFETFGMMDGVDMVLTGATCLHIEVTMDGKPNTDVIRLGAKMVHPTTNTFVVCGK